MRGISVIFQILDSMPTKVSRRLKLVRSLVNLPFDPEWHGSGLLGVSVSPGSDVYAVT